MKKSIFTKMFRFIFYQKSYQSNEIWRASISEGMTGQDLYCLGRASAGGTDDVQEDVRDDAPVEIQGQAPEEDEEEAGDDVDVDKEETEGEKHGGDEKSSSTNDWICSWILCLQ